MDTTQIVALTGAITTLIGALSAGLVIIIKALKGQTGTIVDQVQTAHAKIDAVHIEVNDRLTQLIDATRLAAHQRGYAEGLVQPAPATTGRPPEPPAPTDDKKV